MDRYWLLTWTTYGSWLPGDPRGFVAKQRDELGLPYIHNLPGTPYDADVAPLERAMRASMKGEPIRLHRQQANVLLAQFRETTAYRGWQLLAVGIMANHIHLVVGVKEDPEPEFILHSYESYGSRTLNRQWGKPRNGTWWTESGSKRKLANLAAILAAVEYVRRQEYPLVLWIDEELVSRLSAASHAEPGA